MSVGTASTATRSTPCSAARARASGSATRLMRPACSPVTCPAANAAAMPGRCSSARPVATTRVASFVDRWPWPRSQEVMVLSRSPSAAPETSASRTVRAISAASRFCATSSGRSRSSSAGPNSGVKSSAASASSAASSSSTTPPTGSIKCSKSSPSEDPDQPESAGERPVHRCGPGIDGDLERLPRLPSACAPRDRAAAHAAPLRAARWCTRRAVRRSARGSLHRRSGTRRRGHRGPGRPLRGGLAGARIRPEHPPRQGNRRLPRPGRTTPLAAVGRGGTATSSPGTRRAAVWPPRPPGRGWTSPSASSACAASPRSSTPPTHRAGRWPAGSASASTGRT
jgi:hypothetical protein